MDVLNDDHLNRVDERLNTHALEVRYTDDPAPLPELDFWSYANRWAEECMRYARFFGFM